MCRRLTSTQIHQPPTKHQWLGVAIYNPLLVLLTLFCFPLDFIAEKQNSIIAHMAQEVRARAGFVGRCVWAKRFHGLRGDTAGTRPHPPQSTNAHRWATGWAPCGAGRS